MKYEFLNEKELSIYTTNQQVSFKYEVSIYDMENKCVSI